MDRRTLHAAVAAKHAAVARQRLEDDVAAGALVKVHASVGRHRFRGGVAAVRAG